jgi:serpin B
MTGAPTTQPTGEPGMYDIARGSATLLQAAADNGVLAGTEIDDFGFDLLRHLDTTGNLCASPTSVALALTMVRSGAAGATASELDKVLHDFGSIGQGPEVVALLKALQSEVYYDNSADLAATPNSSGQQPVVELDVSNTVFAQKGMSLEPAYLDSLSSTFGAGVGQLDYSDYPDASRQIINQWANEHTKGRIPQVLQPGDITNRTRIALANAIYLKAGWSYPFNPQATSAASFSRPDGSTVSVPTMAGESWIPYASGPGYRAVRLPLGGDYGSLSMTVIVPDDMASFVAGLTAAKLASIDGRSQTYDVELTMPRFSVNTRTDLVSTLEAMGMTSLFDPTKANLSGITADEQLYIAKVIHQANIDVVEEGVTASAVTVAVGATTGGPPSIPPHVAFHIDKPFLYLVRDGASGAVLFMGRVDDPSLQS